MKTSPKARRKFLKQALVNGTALSALPLGALGTNMVPKAAESPPVPRLPLRIYLDSGLSMENLSKLEKISPEITIVPRAEGAQLESIIPEVDVWFGRIGQAQFKQAERLKWIQSPSAGVERYMYPELIDSETLLTNAKGCYAPAIGDHAIGLLLSLSRNLPSQTRNMLESKWQGESQMVEMKGLTIGIAGLGGIGSQIARRARALDMRVIAVDIRPKYKEQIGDVCDEVRLIQDDNLPWLIRNSDVVACCVPHTKVSEGMFTAEQFQMMKPGSYFLNVSRGKLVKTDHLVEALKTGPLAGAGLDVTDPEPLPPNHELWGLPNVIITSHIAARSQYSSDRMQSVFVENVHRFVQDLPLLNEVDKVAGF